MALTIINSEQVQQYLPMSECITVMAQAMKASSERTVAIPPRSFSALTDNSGMLGIMPGFSAELGSYGAKMISLHPGNSERGLPTIQGFVALFDHASGAPVAIVEGVQLTGIRTAAASGLATRLLARPDASRCGIFGTGLQAATHIDAMCAVRPVTQILVWGRDPDKAKGFADEQCARTGLDIRAVIQPEEAAACDIICTVSASPKPVLMGEWVNPGTHVNLVGAHTLQTREADTSLMLRSAIYTDLIESVRRESGDIMIPVAEGVLRESDIVGEIGQLLLEKVDGRENDEQITLYKSLGIVSQDLYAARYVYERARADAVNVDW
jgi:alanine dehydrogenase